MGSPTTGHPSVVQDMGRIWRTRLRLQVLDVVRVVNHPLSFVGCQHTVVSRSAPAGTIRQHQSATAFLAWVSPPHQRTDQSRASRVLPSPCNHYPLRHSIGPRRRTSSNSRREKSRRALRSRVSGDAVVPLPTGFPRWGPAFLYPGPRATALIPDQKEPKNRYHVPSDRRRVLDQSR